MNHPIQKAYFRPWSPDYEDRKDDNSNDSTVTDRPILDLLKIQMANDKTIHTQPLTCLSPQRSVSSHHNLKSINDSGILDHRHCSINKSLSEQLQTDRHHHHVLQTPSSQENMEMVVKNMQINSVTQNDQRCSVANDFRTSPDYVMKEPWRGVTCLQNRDLFNMPRATLNMGHHRSAFRRIRQSQNYPLPTAKDGEPLDLLPKSLYMNKANGGHLCIFCGKLYSRKYGLKIHLRTHTGFKPLHCKICQRPFGDPSNLNKHIRLHAEGNTPYRCGQCGKVLVRRRDLERHIRSRHPLDMTNSMASIEQVNNFECGRRSYSSSSCSSYDVETEEELDVVGLH